MAGAPSSRVVGALVVVVLAGAALGYTQPFSSLASLQSNWWSQRHSSGASGGVGDERVSMRGELGGGAKRRAKLTRNADAVVALEVVLGALALLAVHLVGAVATLGLAVAHPAARDAAVSVGAPEAVVGAARAQLARLLVGAVCARRAFALGGERVRVG